MDEEEVFNAPYDPTDVPPNEGGIVTKYCCSPLNGRLEWVQSVVTKDSLTKGADVTEEMSDFLLAGDKNPFDKPALLVHKSLGGTGDEPYNVFLEGNSFDRETFDNDVESTVYYAVSQGPDTASAIVTFRFTFKDSTKTRPYKIGYHITLPNGDVIENELINV